MVNFGFVELERQIPAPDMSFVRLFDDMSVGWQLRGQYAFWNGSSPDSRDKYQLLERVGNRVAPIRYEDGRPVFHQIDGGKAFFIDGLAGYWMTFDTAAMWIDLPNNKGGQYAVLAVGGAAGKPGDAVIDWTCPSCGSSISPRTFTIGPMGFGRFLDQADAYAAEFNSDAKLRTCNDCGGVHPPAPGLVRKEGQPTLNETAGA